MFANCCGAKHGASAVRENLKKINLHLRSVPARGHGKLERTDLHAVGQMCPAYAFIRPLKP